jgi:hypothetical protein
MYIVHDVPYVPRSILPFDPFTMTQHFPLLSFVISVHERPLALYGKRHSTEAEFMNVQFTISLRFLGIIIRVLRL